MAFVKERISDEDRAAYAAKGVNFLPHQKSWSIDKEKDTFLMFIGQDRHDMGGTTHSWWHFYHQGKLFKITSDIAVRPNKEERPDYFDLPIVKIELENNVDSKTEIFMRDLSSFLLIGIDKFIDLLSLAFTNFERYYDTADDKRDYEYTIFVKFLIKG